MKQRKVRPLKDEYKAVTEAKRQSNLKEIETLVNELENRMLGREDSSTSVPSISGGRAESNRRKF